MRTITAVRVWLVVFVVGLVLSGLTAFPLEAEVRWASQVLHSTPAPALLPELVHWVDRVRDALTDTGTRYPFLAYGTDWLAFAHLVIAVAFIGPLIDPVRNIWVIRFGMIACAGVIPLALIAGAVRGIPIGWQLIDMSFGVFGVIPLLFAHRLTMRLEAAEELRRMPLAP
jgi:hypothetical protein